MKEPGNFLGQNDLTKNNIREVVMHTEGQASTIEDTEIVIKILYSTYWKADIDRVADSAVRLGKKPTQKFI